ncbi:hypothetical protein MIR68_004079 [Amoeboaphelidium protococcarum]|nr:hypothetical protein MIR68_004079 [Amoeboaphelidium protococcarum]
MLNWRHMIQATALRRKISVKDHYAGEFSLQKLLSKIEQVSSGQDSIVTDDIDSLHVGGSEATLRLVKLAQIQNGSKVLDLGCGLGGTSRMLASQLKCSVLGVDFSEAFIDGAQQIAQLHLAKQQNFELLDWRQHSSGVPASGGQLYYEIGDISATQRIDGEFDVVWICHALMHCRNVQSLMESLHSKLKTGGRAVIYDIFKSQTFDDADMRVPLPFTSDRSQVSLRTLQQFQEYLDGKFKVSQIEDWSSFGLQWMERTRSHVPLISPKLVLGGDSAKMKSMNMRHHLSQGDFILMTIVLNKQE